MTKVCITCDKELDISNFYAKSGRVEEFVSYCKVCWSIRRKAHYVKKRDEAYSAGTRKKNVKRSIPFSGNSREARSLYQAQYNKERSAVDLNFKLQLSLRTRLNKAIIDEYKTGSAVDDLGCSIEELKNYLESKFELGMSWDNWGSGKGTWQIDHKQMLASFDLSKREELLKACHYSNLQPLWFEDHIKKTVQDIQLLQEVRI